MPSSSFSFVKLKDMEKESDVGSTVSEAVDKLANQAEDCDAPMASLPWPTGDDGRGEVGLGCDLHLVRHLGSPMSTSRSQNLILCLAHASPCLPGYRLRRDAKQQVYMSRPSPGPSPLGRPLAHAAAP